MQGKAIKLTIGESKMALSPHFYDSRNTKKKYFYTGALFFES